MKYPEEILRERLRRMLCHHDWQRSRYVNIATGENLGSLCLKCGRVKHD